MVNPAAVKPCCYEHRGAYIMFLVSSTKYPEGKLLYHIVALFLIF